MSVEHNGAVLTTREKLAIRTMSNPTLRYTARKAMSALAVVPGDKYAVELLEELHTEAEFRGVVL